MVPKLYSYWRSSASYRARIALHFKGIAFETLTVDILTGAQGQPAYTVLNPSAYVPALVLDGHTYVESVAIVEMLEERFPTPALLPKSLEDRADVRAMVQVINAGIQPLQNLNVLKKLSPDDATKKAWVRHYNEKGLAALEALLTRWDKTHATNGPFALGEAPSMADVFIVPQVYGALRYGVDVTVFERVSRAAAAADALDAWKRAHPDAQPDAVKS